MIRTTKCKTPSRPLKQPRKPRLVLPRGNGDRRVIPDDGTYVTVACKHPNGVRLRVFEMVDVVEASPLGSRAVKRAQQIGGPDNVVTIAGYCKDREFFGRDGIVNVGFALTHGVPKKFWDLWLSQNADSDLVRRGLIFAHKQEASVRHQILDHEEIWCGLEPIQQTPPSKPWEPPSKTVDPRIKKDLGHRAPTTADKND